MIYRGYSIERERDGTYSAYRIGNSMYDCHTGFASVDAVKLFIDKRL